MRKNALYLATRNLYQDMMVCMKSLLCNTSVEKVYCMIEDDRVPYYFPDCVQFINVKDQTYFSPRGRNYRTRSTYMSMMRVVATKYLDEDITLCLDCDTIFKKNGDELFNTDLGDNYISATLEANGDYKPMKNYCNTGVMLMNLKKMREDGMDDVLVGMLNGSAYQVAEQDALNILFQNKILFMPPNFNANNYTKRLLEEEIVIRHFAAEKRWQACNEYGMYLNMDWEEVEEKNEANKKEAKQ